MEKEERLKIKKEMEKILTEVVEENKWNTLSSTDYEEYKNVTAIGEEITIKGKKLSGRKVNEILEEMKYIKRDGKRIVLTNKGKDFGRYAIAISIHSQKPIIIDSGYAKYKKAIVPKIKEYLEVKAISEENEKKLFIKKSKEPIAIIPQAKPIRIIKNINDEEEK